MDIEEAAYELLEIHGHHQIKIAAQKS